MDEIRKIERMLKTDPAKGLKMLREYIQSWKNMPPKDKKALADAVKRLENTAQKVFEEIYYKKQPQRSDVADALAPASSGLFKDSDLANSILKRVSGMLNNGDNDKAFKLLKRSTDTIGSRVQTLTNTLNIGLSRSNSFDKAVKNGAKKFKYIGPDFMVRSFCAEHLNKTYTIEEIRSMSNGQGLPVEFFCGGYNCRHRWIVVE